MSNALLLQNVVSRITHGLVGVDLYMQEKRNNEYLEDFLSLEMKEVDQALTSMSPRRLVPGSQQISLEDFGTLVKRIRKAKRVIQNLEKEKPEDIESAVNDLKKTMLVFCSVHRR